MAFKNIARTLAGVAAMSMLIPLAVCGGSSGTSQTADIPVKGFMAGAVKG